MREYYNMAIPYWEVQAAKDGNSARSRPRESVQLITIYTMIDAFVDAAPIPSETTDSGYHWHFARVMD